MSQKPKNLVIVESPAKAKTIEKYLGKDYHVAASYGHVRDLPKKGMSIDIEHNFDPTYEVSAEKKKVVNELKKLAKDATTVWLASDEDREGEAIAWHLCMALGLNSANTKRIVFHEITESAIKHAIDNPRTVDQHLVDAQQARRVLDRLVGYELSPVLWKKVQPGLSAGRVQSVAVRLIVEREREIENFKAKSNFKVTAIFTLDKGTLKAELPQRFADEHQAQKFLESIKNASFKVTSLDTKPSKRSPSAPFTTSTLQQEASRKLGFSVRQTMVLAQRLYEEGHITYMRTDSLNLSTQAVQQAASTITKNYGPTYAQTRTFKTKSAGAQEAHEAIRPTNLNQSAAGADRNQQRLYELIWKRTLASQMADALLEKTQAVISISDHPEIFIAKGEMIVFDGFLKVYFEDTDDDENQDNKILPPLKIDQKMIAEAIEASQVYDRPKPRYTEASLVKKLEEEGIGRPSTYAPTISTIQDRGYVEKVDLEGVERALIILRLEKSKITQRTEIETTGADKNKLVPTTVGSLVSDFLVKYVPEIVDYHFTAKVEEEFDDIADGKKAWNKMIAEFYGPFHKTVTETESVSREEASQARELGKDPKTGKPVIARLGRYGPMVQLGHAEDDEKPQFAAIPAGQKLETVTLNEALALFKLPRFVGKTSDGQDILTNNGRFGPYIKFGSLYVSIKPDDPFSITVERAQELASEKQRSEAEKSIKTFENSPIAVLNGRYGPYVSDGKKNVKIPKGTEPEKLTLKNCQKLLAEAPAKKRIRKRLYKPS